jgi:hypothetical protein
MRNLQNSDIEYRNPKQIQNPNLECSKLYDLTYSPGHSVLNFGF